MYWRSGFWVMAALLANSAQAAGLEYRCFTEVSGFNKSLKPTDARALRSKRIEEKMLSLGNAISLSLNEGASTGLVECDLADWTQVVQLVCNAETKKYGQKVRLGSLLLTDAPSSFPKSIQLILDHETSAWPDYQTKTELTCVRQK